MQEYRLSFHITGLFGCIFSLLMFIPAGVEYFSGMENFDIFINSAFFGLFFSILIVVTSYTKEVSMSRRSSFFATTLVWIIITVIASVPLYFAHYPSYNITFIDALFEASSGITTTGATILSNLEHVSKGILLWRAMLQFFGGVGIITLAFIVMPYLQNGAMYFFLTESSESQEKETPRIIDFTILILLVYIVFFILCACCYYLFGMNGFDAICHAMSTVSSGGFSTHDGSFMFFKNVSLENVAIVFMVISGMPFIMVVRLFTRRRIVVSAQALTMIKTFIICSALLFVVYSYVRQHSGTVSMLRHYIFAVVSIGTSTGFASFNFSSYGGFITIILLIVSVVGGCTGSTSGGIKVFRVQVMYQIIKHHFLKTIYPHVVAKIKCDDQVISNAVAMSVIILFMLYIFFLVLSTIVMTGFGFSLTEAITATVAILSNGGMIVSEYGGNVSIITEIPQFVRSIFIVLMILGRLEFIAVLVMIAQLFKRV